MLLSWESVLLRYVDETSSWLPSVPYANDPVRSIAVLVATRQGQR